MSLNQTTLELLLYLRNNGPTPLIKLCKVFDLQHSQIVSRLMVLEHQNVLTYQEEGVIGIFKDNEELCQ